MNIPTLTLQTGRRIGKGYPAYIIAEIGSNHDGELDRALMLVRKAKEAGADAAKFQSFQVEKLINPKWKKNGVWEANPAWEMLAKLSLPKDWHFELAEEAKRVGIDFISTPFDLERLQLLLDIDVPAIKIASGDLTYYELLRAAGKSGKTIFLSTGHATLGEVEAALKNLWEVGCKDIALLHCASIYPTDYADANIPAMRAMQHGFQVQVGYSDHTLGSTVAVGAVAQGACVIEKHLTDNKTRSGPDHSFALEVSEFSAMATQIRQLEDALIGGTKTYRPNEREERIMARRAIYAENRISEGAKLQRESVKFVRACYSEGISAGLWSQIEGEIVAKEIAPDTLITWDMIKRSD